ncbi:hypothetical protein HHK36_019899 [Tetracentron sinense]|uniref:Uncharacterized protein n=1 Tax=Tetracentron sinense TaxID=13715 RepID=A0A835D9I8_TETSI|nr:hypothetical protein HHK36_019899 [Tetracentron sinense]
MPGQQVSQMSREHHIQEAFALLKAMGYLISEETSGDKGNGCFNGTNLDQNFSTGVVGDGNENFQNSDGMMIGLQSSDGNSNEEDNLDYCSDDLFSSFLNSLINEDMFPNQHLHLPHHVIAPPILDPLIPSAQTFGTYGTIWEAALTSSAAALNDNKHKWFVDHVNKHS